MSCGLATIRWTLLQVYRHCKDMGRGRGWFTINKQLIKCMQLFHLWTITKNKWTYMLSFPYFPFFSCYLFISPQRFCLLQGGNLASVHSLSEYYFIQGLIVTLTHGTPLTWIGGSDAQQVRLILVLNQWHYLIGSAHMTICILCHTDALLDETRFTSRWW